MHSLKLLATIIIVPLACLFVYVFTRQLFFLCISRRGTATVTFIETREIEDSDGHVTRHYRISIRFDVDGCSYESDGFEHLVEYPVGSEVAIRYRVSNPSEVHVDYWGSLWTGIVGMSLFVSIAWFLVK
jgi:hypothetical protein